MGNSGAKQGAIPHNKNKLMPLEQKIKLSCTNRDIEVKDFIEFSMPESKRIRGKFDDSDLKKTCFEKALYKCDICNLGGKLNAHHLDGWNWCIEKRFELDNLVCLCQSCHKEFHSLFGSKNNTKQQYIEFKKGQINWPSN